MACLKNSSMPWFWLTGVSFCSLGDAAEILALQSSQNPDTHRPDALSVQSKQLKILHPDAFTR